MLPVFAYCKTKACGLLLQFGDEIALAENVWHLLPRLNASLLHRKTLHVLIHIKATSPRRR